jgi:PAS domain S-box-containing protein
LPDFGQYVDTTQLEIISTAEWYLEDSSFDGGGVLQAWMSKLNEALEEGYEGMRVTGNPDWLDTRSWPGFIAYEKSIHELDPGKMVVLCSYNLGECSASALLDVVTNHEFALVRRDGEWIMVDSLLSNEVLAKMIGERNLIRTMLQTSPDLIDVKDLEGRYIHANEAALEFLGAERVGEIVGRTDSDFFPRETAQKRFQNERKVTTTGQPLPEVEELLPDKTQEGAWFSTSRVPVHTSTGRVVGVLTASRSITHLKKHTDLLEEHTVRLEEIVDQRTKELREAERMSTIGETTTMVGHDLRNPLQAIVNNLYLAKKRLDHSEFDGKDDLAKKLETIREEVGYMNKIVCDLQDFARPVMPKLYKTDIDALTRGVLSSSVTDPTMAVSVAVVVGDGFPLLMVDASLMKRVLTNLVTNAAQAMPEGGELTVELRTEGRDAVISVKDTGTGIPEENMGKLFDPLFTTKSMGQGFGLPVCKRLVEAHGGTIAVESTVGKGSVFTIRLPLDTG